jgi:hypothetical protein
MRSKLIPARLAFSPNQIQQAAGLGCKLHPAVALRDTYRTLETHREPEDEAIQYANQGAKCLRLRNLAERQGFEPWVQVLARTTV